MINKWKYNFASDCTVIELKEKFFVYCIFKNARSSLMHDQWKLKLKMFTNEHITDLDCINVFIREPIERFVSGVHTYLYHNRISDLTPQIKNTIETLSLNDKHIMPQYFWLLHLLKYYKGKINILPIKELYNILLSHKGPWSGSKNPLPWTPLSDELKKEILNIDHKNYTAIDQKIIKKYIGKTINLKKLANEIRNDLS